MATLGSLNNVLRGGFPTVPFVPMGLWVDNLVFGAAGAFTYNPPTIVSTVPPLVSHEATYFRIVSSAPLWVTNQAAIASAPAANNLLGTGPVYVPANLPYTFNAAGLPPPLVLYFWATAAASLSIEAWL